MKGVECLFFHNNTRNMGVVRACLHFLVFCLYIAEHPVTPFGSFPWCDDIPDYGYYEYDYFDNRLRMPLNETSTPKPILRRDAAGNLELVSAVTTTLAPPAATGTTAGPNHEPSHRPHQDRHQPPNHRPHHQHQHQPQHQRHQQRHHQPHGHLHQPHHQRHNQSDH
ncbi:histidine-rich glycoprotein-like [Spodoptera frugiperda]|uniref:Histidine-rich glycoprotein-like n=1 Tax=Spodoptera frugiperda TaxID=7108 RepID=A0A9R0D610_SPOFR|nr:histidine-rich glycoprotein-like [Spodoptera frugiperda]